MFVFRSRPLLNSITKMAKIYRKITVVCQTTTVTWRAVSMTEAETEKLIKIIYKVKDDVRLLEIDLRLEKATCCPECPHCVVREMKKPTSLQIDRLVEVVKECSGLTSLTLELMKKSDVHRFFLEEDETNYYATDLPSEIKHLMVRTIGSRALSTTCVILLLINNMCYC